MKDLKLGTDSTLLGFGEGDFGIDPFGDAYNYYHDTQVTNGDLELISDGPEVMQATKIAIYFIRGDWFLNLLAGIPWFSEMFSTQVSFARKRSLIKEAILQTTGITQLREFTFEHDRENRNAEIAYTVATSFDSIESGKINL